MNKNINFDDDLVKDIQKFANENTDGNFTRAVDILARSALLNSKLNVDFCADCTPFNVGRPGDVDVDISFPVGVHYLRCKDNPEDK